MSKGFLTQVAKEATNEAPQLRMNLKEFMQKMAEFSKFGESLYKTKKMTQLAEELEELACHAEAYALKETDDEGEAFDNVTIKRNMNELKKYVAEFKKIATENDRLTQRSTALYEDMGRVLGRYYEIKGMDEFVDTYGSETVPADEQEKQVKNQPMTEITSAQKAQQIADLKKQIEQETERIYQMDYDEFPDETAKKQGQTKLKTLRDKLDKLNSTKIEKSAHEVNEDASEQIKKLKQTIQNYDDKIAKHTGTPGSDDMTKDWVRRRYEARAKLIALEKSSSNVDEQGKQGMNERIFNIQRQFRKMHLREVAYLRNKARMIPEERQAMFNKIKNDKKLMEQITIEFGEKLMKKVEDDVPYGDLVKLTTKKFNMNDDCEGFYEEMRGNGFKLIGKIWEDRPPIGPNMFIEFYVPKDQFNDANSMANRIVPDYQK